MIEISGLSKAYGAKEVLRDITFTARRGRVTAFLGRNGAGKSSTLRILLGLDKASSGNALINGRPYSSLVQPLKTVGALIDGAGPLPERRAIDHLTWIAQSNRIPKVRVMEVLDLLELAEARRARVRTYSLGMKQRLGIAAALLGEPDILILDEPVNGLDPDGIRWFRTYMRDYAARGHTVLLSSHLMAETANTADDVVIVHRGSVVAQGTLAEVIGRYDSLEDAFFVATGEQREMEWQ